MLNCFLKDLRLLLRGVRFARALNWRQVTRRPEGTSQRRAASKGPDDGNAFAFLQRRSLSRLF